MMPDMWGPSSAAEVSETESENAKLRKHVKELEAQNAELSGEIGQLEANNKLLQDAVDQWELVAASPGAVEDMARENTELLEKVEQLQAERDAAVDDKRGDCTYCAYLPGETIPQTCFDCANKGYYRWEWRGATKEDAE